MVNDLFSSKDIQPWNTVLVIREEKIDFCIVCCFFPSAMLVFSHALVFFSSTFAVSSFANVDFVLNKQLEFFMSFSLVHSNTFF